MAKTKKTTKAQDTVEAAVEAPVKAPKDTTVAQMLADYFGAKVISDENNIAVIEINGKRAAVTTKKGFEHAKGGIVRLGVL